VIDFGMDMDKAVEAPRFHSYSTDGKTSKLYIESRISDKVQEGLKILGHEIEIKDAYDPYFGGAQGIMIEPDSNKLMGGADSRRDGFVSGY
jgi:gamma-glutamyltranspeptidase/glutathione hydrolase